MRSVPPLARHLLPWWRAELLSDGIELRHRSDRLCEHVGMTSPANVDMRVLALEPVGEFAKA